MSESDQARQLEIQLRKSGRGNLLRHVGMIVIVIVDFANFYWLLSKGLPALLFIHLVLAVLFVLLLQGVEREDFAVKRNFIYISWFLSVLLPGYGLFGLLILFHYIIRADTPSTHSFEPDEFFMPETHKAVIKNVDAHILSIAHDEIEVDAFTDILRTNDRKLEESAINKLAKTLTQQSVRILQDVIKNATSDTRILAASAIIEMEDGIIEKIEHLRNSIDAEPGNLRAVLNLARMYDLYCYLGVLDESVKKHYQSLCHESYRIFLKHFPDDHTAMLEYGRTLLNSNQIEQSIDVLKQTLTMTDDDLTPRLWLAEAHYRSGNYEKVGQICERLSTRHSLPENIKQVVSVWRSPQTPVQ